ncbi:MAG: RHS repeat-associated core domain-containing protein [Thermoleophilia bacterium]|nr:RHS repeat-associated core domain-containing protein [Thermoleophilia bacterium]
MCGRPPAPHRGRRQVAGPPDPRRDRRDSIRRFRRRSPSRPRADPSDVDARTDRSPSVRVGRKARRVRLTASAVPPRLRARIAWLDESTRYYDPALGRFTQPDPVEGGSLNRYDYAGQDPINNVDLDGRDYRGACAEGGAIGFLASVYTGTGVFAGTVFGCVSGVGIEFVSRRNKGAGEALTWPDRAALGKKVAKETAKRVGRRLLRGARGVFRVRIRVSVGF